MGEGIAVALHGHGARRMTVLNRTEEHGRSIADRVDGTVQLLAALDHALVELTSLSPAPALRNRSSMTDMARPASSPDRPTLITTLRYRETCTTKSPLDVTVLNLDDASWASLCREEPCLWKR